MPFGKQPVTDTRLGSKAARQKLARTTELAASRRSNLGSQIAVGSRLCR